MDRITAVAARSALSNRPSRWRGHQNSSITGYPGNTHGDRLSRIEPVDEALTGDGFALATHTSDSMLRPTITA